MNSHKRKDSKHSVSRTGNGSANLGSNQRRTVIKQKPVWNDNVADPERFKLNQKELLKRKELLVSKHNVLSENYKPPKERSILHKLKTPKKLSKSQPSSAQKRMDSLDLLTRDSEDEENHDGSLASGSDDDNDDLDSFDRNLAAMKSQATSREDYNLSLSSEPRLRSESRTRLKDRTYAPNIKQLQQQRASSQSKRVATNFVVTPDEKIEKPELTMIADEIQNLRQELRLYEELSGKKTILDAEELDEVFAIGEDESPIVNQKTVTRYLVQLVCQSMTYLLKAQVDKETLQAEVELLRARVTELGDVVETRNHAALSFSRYNEALPPPPPPAVAPAVSVVTPEARRQVTHVSPSPAISIPRVSHTAPESNHVVTPSLAQQAQQELSEKQNVLKAAFRGTSTTDFLFMPNRSSPAAMVTPQPQQVAAESLQAADLAAQTYDLYLKQRSEVRETGGMGNSYDDMIERLSYKFTSNLKGEQQSEQLPSLSPAPRVESEGFSIVTPNAGGLPVPAKPSQHPYNVTSPTYLQQEMRKDLFSPSPASKRVYDATLGSYEPIQQD